VEYLLVALSRLIVAGAVAVLHEFTQVGEVDLMREIVGKRNLLFQSIENIIHLEVAWPTSHVAVLNHVARPAKSILRFNNVGFAQVARLTAEPRINSAKSGVRADQPPHLVVGSADEHEA